MAFLDDVVDSITADITAIGLSEDGSTEYSGGSYAALAPSYGAAASGAADLSATLEFDGAANDGPVTHLIFKRAAGDVIRPVDTSRSFNSDGRLDLTSALVNADFLA
jgi:hypothetical protein